MGPTEHLAPIFGDEFQAQFERLLIWRRDVRRFRRDLLPSDLLDRILDLACLAPSVGYSQPWRFVSVDSAAARAQARASFEACNAMALAGYKGERAALYAQLKLSGMDDAPQHLAVFADHDSPVGAGLGQATMPETLDYSAVAAVQILWLAARALGVGVGWVSILDPAAVSAAVGAPSDWRLIAYLCLGWPEEEHPDPELVRAGWQGVDPRARELRRA